MFNIKPMPRVRHLARTSLASVVRPDNETLINEYLEWKQTHAPVAANRYRVWITRFQQFTNKAPEHLEIGDWTAFADALKGRFAPKSVQFALNIVHNYLRFWQEQGRLRNLPLYLAKVPKAMANSHYALKEEEYRRMVAVLRNRGDAGVRDLAIIMLLHDTGLRVGEIVSIEIDQLEEDASAVVRSEKTVQRRRVFWNRDTDEILRQYLVDRINRGAKTDWLFVSQNLSGEETSLTTRSVQRIVTETARAAGIERKTSPHSFRHGYIHRLAAMSVPDAIIAQLVGHTTPHTISHYTKLSRPEFKDFACRQFRQLPAAA